MRRERVVPGPAFDSWQPPAALPAIAPFAPPARIQSAEASNRAGAWLTDSGVEVKCETGAGRSSVTTRSRERLGVGGMAEVYRAIQSSLGREVAHKVLTPSLVEEKSFLKRFEIEARKLASLSSPSAR